VICNLNEHGGGIEGAVFGHIETHKDLVDRICGDLGIELLLPLWKQNSEQIITDFVDAGFEAIIVSAKADLFGKEWLGRQIDKKLRIVKSENILRDGLWFMDILSFARKDK